MGKVSLRHEIVGLEDLVDVFTVDTDRDSHHHVLRSLDNLAVDSEEVRSLERLEAEIVVGEISVVNDGRVEQVLVLHDDFIDVVGDHGGVFARLGVDPLVQVLDHARERLFRLFVQVRDGDSGGEDRIVRVLGREVGSGFGRQVLDCQSDIKERVRDSRRARRW